MNRKLWLSAILGLTSLLLFGCASSKRTYPDAGGITYNEDKELHKVWLAKGFNFRGYDTVYVAETQATIAPLREESNAFDLARRLVRDEFAAALQESRLFRNVVTSDSDIKPGSKVLRLETWIKEFRRGTGDAPPVIGILGKILDNGQAAFQFDSRRAGSSTFIETTDIRSMAKALAAFIRRSIH